ncbi:MAG: gluconate 2-dehydrogenase subunit 3 family protein [Candidatus Aquicultor sp.]
MVEEFDVMSWQQHWDDTTRRVIEKRVTTVPGQDFFNDTELRALETLIEAIIPGVHGDVPIKETLGCEVKGSYKKGVRPVNMPWRPDMYREGLEALEKEANDTYGRGIGELFFEQVTELLGKIQHGHVTKDYWPFPAPLFFKTLVADIAAIYYSFPQSWNQMKFAGPAYPYGYYRLECDERMKHEPALEEDDDE